MHFIASGVYFGCMLVPVTPYTLCRDCEQLTVYERSYESPSIP